VFHGFLPFAQLLVAAPVAGARCLGRNVDGGEGGVQAGARCNFPRDGRSGW